MIFFSQKQQSNANFSFVHYQFHAHTQSAVISTFSIYNKIHPVAPAGVGLSSTARVLTHGAGSNMKLSLSPSSSIPRDTVQGWKSACF